MSFTPYTKIIICVNIDGSTTQSKSSKKPFNTSLRNKMIRFLDEMDDARSTFSKKLDKNAHPKIQLIIEEIAEVILRQEKIHGKVTWMKTYRINSHGQGVNGNSQDLPPGKGVYILLNLFTAIDICIVMENGKNQWIPVFLRSKRSIILTQYITYYFPNNSSHNDIKWVEIRVEKDKEVQKRKMRIWGKKRKKRERKS